MLNALVEMQDINHTKLLTIRGTHQTVKLLTIFNFFYKCSKQIVYGTLPHILKKPWSGSEFFHFLVSSGRIFNCLGVRVCVILIMSLNYHIGMRRNSFPQGVHTSDRIT